MTVTCKLARSNPLLTTRRVLNERTNERKFICQGKTTYKQLIQIVSSNGRLPEKPKGQLAGRPHTSIKRHKTQQHTNS